MIVALAIFALLDLIGPLVEEGWQDDRGYHSGRPPE